MTEPDFKDIFEKLPGDYIVVKSNAPDFTLVAVTDSHLSVIGMKREHFVGEKIFDLFPDTSGNLEKVKIALNEVIATKAPCRPEIMRYDVKKEGSEETIPNYFTLEYSPIFDVDGDVSYIVQLSSDITELVKLGLKIPGNQK